MANVPQANPVGNVIPASSPSQIKTPNQASVPKASPIGTTGTFTNTGGDIFQVTNTSFDELNPSIPDR